MKFVREVLVVALFSFCVSFLACVRKADAGTEYLHILSSGQSLSFAGFGGALSVSQPYGNKMLSPSVQGTSGPLIPLMENYEGFETPSSGMANSLFIYDSLRRPVAVGLHGVGGSPYSYLKKGTAAYANGMAQAFATKALVEVAGGIYKPIGVTIVHGESDNEMGNADKYEGYLKEWQNDYQTDINALTGSSGLLPMFTNQMSQDNYGGGNRMAVAQLNAHKNNSGKIILVGPKYQYNYSPDRLHLSNIESKHMGEMFAKVIKKTVFDGQAWNPLMPVKVERVANIITVTYAIPVGNLAIDTTNVALRPNYGFEFAQTGGNAVSITSIQLINGNKQVQIILSGVPAGGDQRLRYAWTCYGGAQYCGNASDPAYFGGNIRDTDSSISPAAGNTGMPLYDWGVTFDEPVSIVNNSKYIGQNVPALMAAGQTYPVSVTMKNIGTGSWTAAGWHALGTQNPRDNMTWGLGRVSLSASDLIGPGQTKEFVFNITAPSVAGVYNFLWQMVQDGVEWFGEAAPNVAINVVSGMTISGKVAKNTGEGISGVKIELCGAATDPVTDANGNWSATVAAGAGYCARIISGLPGGYTSVVGYNDVNCSTVNTSYEWQVAGQNVFSQCSAAGVAGWDRSLDTGINFTVNYPSSCVARTCASLGNYQCGSWSNGCGGTVACGSCASGQVCSNGRCVANCTTHASKKCDGGKLYWYNSCDAKEELYQDCGSNVFTSNYQCAGTWVQRSVTTKGCANNACTSVTGWSNVENCASGQMCTAGKCVTNCIAKTCAQLNAECGAVADGCGGNLACGSCGSGQTCRNNKCAATVADCIIKNYKKCVGNDLYWYDSCDSKGDLAENCGTDRAISNYRCRGNLVQRETMVRGCSDNSCTKENTWNDVADCSKSGQVCSDGVCIDGAAENNDENNSNLAALYAQIALLKQKIAAVQAQLAAINGNSPAGTFSCSRITKKIVYGMKNDPQVKCLQEVLRAEGMAVIPTGTFGKITRIAVTAFQQKYAGEILTPLGFTAGTGIVGNATTAKINAILGR